MGSEIFGSSKHPFPPSNLTWKRSLTAFKSYFCLQGWYFKFWFLRPNSSCAFWINSKVSLASSLFVDTIATLKSTTVESCLISILFTKMGPVATFSPPGIFRFFQLFYTWNIFVYMLLHTDHRMGMYGQVIICFNSRNCDFSSTLQIESVNNFSFSFR